MYVRVSSKEQEQGFSIPAQRQLLKDYAEREGIHVVQEFEDVETAKRAGRTSFSEMVAFLRKKSSGCRTLLVEKTDRLYRNIKDWVTIDELGIEVHFVKEAVVLSEDSRSSEKFMHGIKVLMAKNYIDNLGEEVRNHPRHTKRRHASAGLVTCRRCGWPNKHLFVEPSTAPRSDAKMIRKRGESYAADVRDF
jgi:site-specific DNA recombinase